MDKPDLNLFVIFNVIMQEQSMSAAAKRLHMTQPSVSNAVSRMRHQWNDTLFVKQGRGIKPTPYANHLWQTISEPLNIISSAVNPPQFIPAHARKTFRISLTDAMASLLWRPLRKKIEQEAPGIDVHAVPFRANGEQLLLDNEVDLVLDIYKGGHQLVHSRWMSDLKFVCVMRPDHALAEQPLNLDNFLAADHLLVSHTGEAQGMVDSELTNLGKSRRIAMTVNTFSCVFPLLADSNLITILPEAIASNYVAKGDVITKVLPIKVADVAIYTAWHSRQNRDPALRWLMDIINKIYAEVVDS